MKKLSNKTIILIVVILFLIINFGLLFSYSTFFLSDQMVNDLVAARNENYECIDIIIKSTEDKKIDDAIDFMKMYIKNNGGHIILKDVKGKVIYTNSKDISRLFSTTSLINIGNINYELTYSKIDSAPGIKLIRNFMLYEIIFVSSAIIIIFYISSKKIIEPIDIITKDINAYKFGKRPFKRKMPKNIEQIQNAFVDMVDNLEIEKEHQNQIIASISHDIKTPLTSVIGYADRLKNKNLSEEKKLKYIDKIYSKAITMKGILEEFDDYQSCNIKDSLKLENITINNIIEFVKEDYEDELYDKNILLNIKSNCNNKKVNVDVIKLKRVFSNIITNSVKNFKGQNGIINVEIASRDDVIRFEIADNGGGLKEENALKKIFEPLYTSDPSRKIPGLGLSICKQIIRSFEGNIYAKNNNIGGLSIIFLLPKI